MRWFLWWFAILALYLLEFCAQELSEVAAGAIIAGLCSILVWRALVHADTGVQVRWRWVRRLAGVPVRMLSDSLLVSRRILWALATGNELAGFYERVPYEPGDRGDAFTMGREALVVEGLNAGPNSIVAEVDVRGELLLHRLVAVNEPPKSPEWPL